MGCRCAVLGTRSSLRPAAELVAAATWQEALDNALRLLGGLQPHNNWPGHLDGIAAGFDDGDAHVIWTRAETPRWGEASA